MSRKLPQHVLGTWGISGQQRASRARLLLAEKLCGIFIISFLTCKECTWRLRRTSILSRTRSTRRWELFLRIEPGKWNGNVRKHWGREHVLFGMGEKSNSVILRRFDISLGYKEISFITAALARRWCSQKATLGHIGWRTFPAARPVDPFAFYRRVSPVDEDENTAIMKSYISNNNRGSAPKAVTWCVRSNEQPPRNGQ